MNINFDEFNKEIFKDISESNYTNKKDLPMLKEETFKILSYCDIPEELTSNHWISDFNSNVYIEYTIVNKEEQIDYNDDFSIDNWILEKHPELENTTILIHIDY